MGVTVNNPASNGLPSGPQLVPGGQSAVPVILPSSGTITNGVLSALTALPTAYGGAWMYFPAGASLPSGAGLYWVSSVTTTGGNITTTFANAAAAFTPDIPSNPVLITSGGAAYTQTIGSDITLANVTVPGGSMGSNGALRTNVNHTLAATTGSKLVSIKLGGQAHSIWTSASAGITNVVSHRVLRNRGVLNAQMSDFADTGYAGFGNGTFTPAVKYPTPVNTAADQPLTITANISTNTDYIVLEGFTVEVLPS